MINKQMEINQNLKSFKMESDSPLTQHTDIKQQTVQQEKIPDSKKYSNERLDKQYQISINLIAQTSLDDSMTNALSQQQKISMVLELKSIHLQWLNIKRIQNLQVFERLTVLYLQHNRIKKIQNLDCLKNLQYLALNDNLITRVENLKHLGKLQGLNLTNNHIEDVNARDIPQTVQLLSFKNNPITLDANYKKDILCLLKSLQVLDDIVITPQQKIKAIGKFPLELLEYAQQMNHFRKKKEVEKSLKEQIKPILLGSEAINEKEAELQIRTKTRKLLHQNQQNFQREMKETNEEFTQKVTVSKNIRHIKQEEEKSRKERLDQIRAKKLEEIDREIGDIKRAVKAQMGLSGNGKEKFSKLEKSEPSSAGN